MSLQNNPWGAPPPEDPPEEPSRQAGGTGRRPGASLGVWVFRWLAVVLIGVLVLDLAGVSRGDFWGPAREVTRTTGAGPATMPLLRPVRPSERTPELAGTPMTFEIARRGGSQVLLAKGDFLPGTAASFESAVAAMDAPVAIVSLDSPGGSVGDAVALGRAIRARGMSTLVERGRLCASACAYAFAGGLERMVERGGVVGVHQSAPYDDRTTTASSVMSSTQYMTAQLLSYLDEMGVRARLLTLALQTPHDRLHILDTTELADTGLVTGEL